MRQNAPPVADGGIVTLLQRPGQRLLRLGSLRIFDDVTHGLQWTV